MVPLQEYYSTKTRLQVSFQNQAIFFLFEPRFFNTTPSLGSSLSSQFFWYTTPNRSCMNSLTNPRALFNTYCLTMLALGHACWWTYPFKNFQIPFNHKYKPCLNWITFGSFAHYNMVH
jgi:hypothetical protein